MNPWSPLSLLAAIVVLCQTALAQELPDQDQVFTISIKPHAHQLTDFFTPERLKASLPLFKRAYVTPPIGGKIWTQSGVIVLNDKRVLYWKSYRDDVLAIETAVDPVYYVIDRE